jgi:HEAT repeat protein
MSPEEQSALSSRIQETLARAASGDQESARDAATALMQVLQKGAAAFPALRDAYLASADPRARMMMLPSMLFGGGEEARSFVVDQVKTETDPDLHRALLQQAAGFATPQYAPALKDTFLQTASAPDTDAATRAAAIRGLRYAQGEDVQEALLTAASDSSEDIRLAAIENLASRPAMREALRDAIGREPSSRVREIGQCRLLIAEGGG